MIVKNTSSSFALAVRFPQTVPDSTGFEDTGRKPGSLAGSCLLRLRQTGRKAGDSQNSVIWFSSSRS